MKYLCMLLFIAAVDCRGIRIPLQSVAKNSRTFSTIDTDHRFMAAIGVGTPPVPVSVLFDTGSNALWITSSYCSNTTCSNFDSNITVYDDKKSETAVTDRSDIHNITYVIGMVLGYGSHDVVQLPNVTVPNAPFIQAFSVEKLSKQSGTIGLSPLSTILSAIFDNNADFKPVFSINSYPNGGGELVIGDTNAAYENQITYHPLYDDDQWFVTVQQASLGGVTLGMMAPAVVDSGTSLIVMVPEAYNILLKHLGGTTIAGYMQVPSYINATLEVTFDGVTYAIPEDNLVLLQTGTIKVLNIIQRDDTYGVWILGVPFFKANYVEYDFENKQVGVAPKTY